MEYSVYLCQLMADVLGHHAVVSIPNLDSGSSDSQIGSQCSVKGVVEGMVQVKSVGQVLKATFQDTRPDTNPRSSQKILRMVRV